MRKIQFRGKRVDNDQWVCGFLAIDQEDEPFIIEHFYGCTNLGLMDQVVHEVYKESVGEYTGLKNIDGNDIYEGDILKYNDTIQTIEYYEGGELSHGQGSITGFYFGKIWCVEECEIIGNIYENKDLLK